MLLASAVGAYAQKTDASIVGHVIESQSGEHIPYVTLSLDGTNVGTVTDGSGHYSLRNLPTGEFTLTASAVGYGSEDLKVNIAAGKTLEANFKLTEQLFAVDQIVVSSSRTASNRKMSSSIVNTTSEQIFSTTASANLAESMNFQPGLRTENTCGNCGSSSLRINGLEGQYSQILLDSRPIFSSLASVYGLEQLPVAMIDRVEVIRGGGSALYGSSAIAGVVNIITKEPLRSTAVLSNTTQVLKGGTTDITTSINAAVVTDDNKAGLYAFGQIRNREAYDRNEDGFSDIPQQDTETLGFRGYFKTSPFTKITAEYHHINEYRRGGDQLDIPAHNAEVAEQLDHQIDGGGLNFEYLSRNYKNKASIYASAQRIVRDSYYGTIETPEAYGNTKDQTYVAGGQHTYSYTTGNMPSNLTSGVEYNYNYVCDVVTGVEDRTPLDQQTDVIGVFAQNEWVNDKFNFLIGGRLDKHNMIDNVIFSPRASIRYTPFEQLGLRASYSSGYRAPQAFSEDLHIEAVGGTVSFIELADDLKAEYSHSITASADMYRKFGKIEANLLIEGFYTKLNDVFVLEEKDVQSTSIIYERRNGDGAIVRGLSADLKFGILDMFEVQGGYTFQKSTYTVAEAWCDDVEATKTMLRSPDHYGYFVANYFVTDRFETSLFGNYTGSMLVAHEAEVNETVKSPSFWDFGVQLSYSFPLTKLFTMEINGGVKNILDSYQDDLDYGAEKDPGYVYGPTLPRTFFVGAKLLF